VLGEIAKQESLVRAVCGAEGIATFTNFPFFPSFPEFHDFHDSHNHEVLETIAKL
jgi:hypothetical protein